MECTEGTLISHILESFYPTQIIKWKIINGEKVLHQMYQGSQGTIQWEIVETVEEEI